MTKILNPPHGPMAGDPDAHGYVASTTVHPVDDKTALPQKFILGLQHVLAMYAGAVAVPLVVGGALINSGKMQAGDLPHLIAADLFVAGLAALIQSIGFWRFGARLPLMQGVSFVAVAPMIAIGSQYGITAIYGSVIAAGLIMILLSSVFGRIVKYFPPLVTGTIITVIGLSLIKIPAGWIVSSTIPPTLLHGWNYVLAIISLGTVFAIHRYASPRYKPLAVLGGIIVGTIVAQFAGLTNWSKVEQAHWFEVPLPFQFGFPTFELGAVLTMALVGLVIMAETSGDIVAVAKIAGRPATKRTLSDGLRADGLSTLLGGIFDTFPYSAFAQNVGLVSLTKVFSRYVVTAAGVILIVLGMLPKLGSVVAAVPSPVLGGAGVALFGMIIASGIRTLTSVEWTETRALIVGASITIALLPVISPTFYDGLPSGLAMVLDSGITMGALTIILFNLLLNRENNGHIDLQVEEELQS